eukprot:1184843-Prorocentrum_minimum.AAC.2
MDRRRITRRVRRGPGGGLEGIYRSSLDARKPQNPINSEEDQGHFQGFPGASSVCDVVGVRRGSGGGGSAELSIKTSALFRPFLPIVHRLSDPGGAYGLTTPLLRRTRTNSVARGLFG